MIQIMLPRRSYSRRLKSVKNEIYELFPSARRAYNSIRLAVKTKSTPLCKGTFAIVLHFLCQT